MEAKPRFLIDEPEKAKAIMVNAMGGYCVTVTPDQAAERVTGHCYTCKEVIASARKNGRTVQVHYHTEDNDVHAISYGKE